MRSYNYGNIERRIVTSLETEFVLNLLLGALFAIEFLGVGVVPP